MIAEGVEHDVAGAETDGIQRPCAAPGIGLGALGLEDRARRGEQPRKRAGRGRDEAAERRGGLVQRRQLGLPQHRQARQRGPAGDGGGVEAGKPFRIGRRLHGLAQHAGQPGEQVGLAACRVAGLQGVKMVTHEGCSGRLRFGAYVLSDGSRSGRGPVRGKAMVESSAASEHATDNGDIIAALKTFDHRALPAAVVDAKAGIRHRAASSNGLARMAAPTGRRRAGSSCSRDRFIASPRRRRWAGTRRASRSR